MRPISAVIGIMLALGLGTMASAGQILASDPQTLMDYFFDEGIPAQLKADSIGDPLVEFRHESEKFSVYFYGCTENTDCQSIQFYRGYETEETVTAETLNAFNEERLYVRTYQVESGTARIEMDVFTGTGGISDRDLGQMFSVWIRRIAEFEEALQ